MVKFRGISIGVNVNKNEWDYENVVIDFDAICDFSRDSERFVKVIISDTLIHWIDWDKVVLFSLESEM